MAAQVCLAEARERAIAGLWELRLKTVTDDRGTVREFLRASAFAELGVPAPDRWTQINLTRTRRGAVRGLHGEAVTKLIGLASGTALGAYLDARPDSPTYGTVVTEQLEVGMQVLVPPGVCNGFQAITDCEYLYLFDAEWQPDMPGVAVRPTDPALGIAWPLPIDAIDPATISAKDATAPLFAELRG
ncbi:MAG TPA: dTDP-4-dehydrorhamnose 3,5-epimerase [Jatrophihabitans sp.]|jgi:dTDP-4-dehydrorhamnose 3,5-epimerase|nr:dTDP-4-dehydrorhamnose 3,5-epimerase [Jatrophihabitans sp.]